VVFCAVVVSVGVVDSIGDWLEVVGRTTEVVVVSRRGAVVATSVVVGAAVVVGGSVNTVPSG
jgi:hypothetical protein